jgi:endonuclease-3
VAGTHTKIRQRRPTALPIRRSFKKPFDIDVVMRRLRAAVKPHTPAAMFQLADEGYRSLFEQLVACIISIRTLEEVTLPTCRRL